MTGPARPVALTLTTLLLFVGTSWLAADDVARLEDDPLAVRLAAISVIRLAWIPTALMALQAWMTLRLVRVQAETSAPVAPGDDDQESIDSDDGEWADRMRALTRAAESLTMYLQPIVDLRTGRTAGFEALARFDTSPPHPPDWWFSEAHRLGRGIDLEHAAICRALAYLDSLPAGMYLSLNLSPATAQSDPLRGILRHHDAARVVLELTEHDIVDDYETLRRNVGALVADGARLAVDDAGAGFASLRHILNLAPAIVKLDRSLVAGIDIDRYRRALAASLVRFAAEAGVEVVAEGVERDEELRTLAAIGIPYAQGFLLGRPAPPAEAMAGHVDNAARVPGTADSVQGAAGTATIELEKGGRERSLMALREAPGDI